MDVQLDTELRSEFLSGVSLEVNPMPIQIRRDE